MTLNPQEIDQLAQEIAATMAPLIDDLDEFEKKAAKQASPATWFAIEFAAVVDRIVCGERRDPADSTKLLRIAFAMQDPETARTLVDSVWTYRALKLTDTAGRA